MPEIINGQSRLLVGEVESVNVSAIYTTSSGWCCHIMVRRQFQTWAEAAHGRYEQMNSPELLTLIDAALSAELKV